MPAEQCSFKGPYRLRLGGVSDRTAVGFGMVFGGFAGMVRRMKSMAVCSVCVMGGLFVVTRRMMFGGCLMVSRSMLVMFCSFSVMFRSFVVLHRNIPLSWRHKRKPAQGPTPRTRNSIEF